MPDEALQAVAKRQFGFEFRRAPVVLVLVAGDTWEAPLLVRGGGWTGGPSVAESAALLRYWSQVYGAELVAVGEGHMELETRTLSPHDVRSVALEVVALEGGVFARPLDRAKEVATGSWYIGQ